MIMGKIINDTVEVVKNNSNGIISYLLHNWFGKTYQKFLTNKILISQKAEIEAKNQLIKEYSNSDFSLISQMKNVEIELEYRNMAGVLSKLEGKISENAEGNIDPDKMKRLKDLSKEYSSEEMQEYIAKILAGEYNKSGTYSLQTLEILKSISKEELEIFQKFKSVIIDDFFIFQEIFGNIDLMDRFNLKYKELLLLNSLGLISLNDSSRGRELNENHKFIAIKYNGSYFFMKGKDNLMLNNLYFLTRSGQEIYNLLDDNYNEDYIEYLKEYLKKYEIDIYSKEEINFS